MEFIAASVEERGKIVARNLPPVASLNEQFHQPEFDIVPRTPTITLSRTSWLRMIVLLGGVDMETNMVESQADEECWSCADSFFGNAFMIRQIRMRIPATFRY